MRMVGWLPFCYQFGREVRRVALLIQPSRVGNLHTKKLQEKECVAQSSDGPLRMTSSNRITCVSKKRDSKPQKSQSRQLYTIGEANDENQFIYILMKGSDVGYYVNVISYI